MLIQMLLLVLGFVLLIKGAGWLVDGASALAKKYHVSDLAIGLTIVAFGTSAPEMVVNTIAASQGYFNIVFGNVVGSNNFNLFIILGISGIITPLVVQSSTVWKEIPFSLLAVIVVFALVSFFPDANKQILTSLEGGVLLVLFAGFLYYVYKQLKTDPGTGGSVAQQLTNTRLWVYITLGLSGLIGGGQLVVENAVKIATSLGMSEKLVGLTIVAAGTSLPELVTSIVAAIKKNVDIAVGNIIGSNIFNLLLVLGLSAMVNPLEYTKTFNMDILLLAGGTLFLFIAMFTGQRKKLDRWEALILLLTYLSYTTYLIV